MLKRDLSILFILFLLSGCATTVNEQAPLLKAKVANLSQVLEEERKDKQDLLKTINEQEQEMQALTQASEQEKGQARTLAKSKTKTYYQFVIRIQTALRNAGFRPGLIDGKIGKQTLSALKRFQEANDLTPDGRVDKQTWALLREYLY